jgi:hypothetical protein
MSPRFALQLSLLSLIGHWKDSSEHWMHKCEYGRQREESRRICELKRGRSCPNGRYGK